MPKTDKPWYKKLFGGGRTDAADAAARSVPAVVSPEPDPSPPPPAEPVPTVDPAAEAERLARETEARMREEEAEFARRAAEAAEAQRLAAEAEAQRQREAAEADARRRFEEAEAERRRALAALEAARAPVQPAPEAPKGSWWQRLKTGLSRTSTSISGGITAVFTKRKLDADTIEELEDVLVQADLGVETATRVVQALAKGRYDKEISDDEVKRVLAEEVTAVLAPVARPLVIERALAPHVVLVVGVNGTGKTTTIGKLASQYRKAGLKVMLAAGDTFRAAAIEQLKIWGERTGSPVVASTPGADAAGLAFDALKRAKAEGADLLVIDTAGRLQNKAELMAELEKVIRVLKKQDESAPHSVLLTLDATTGQNALQQVEIFGKVAGVTGLVMTKLDGTARGGILVAIAARHGLPVHYIGVGEGIDDLEPFDAADFAKAIAGLER